MGSLKFLLLSVFAILLSLTIVSCDDDGGGDTKTKKCSAPTECKENQDCVFDSLDAQEGVCKNRVTCETKDDCSDGLHCLEDSGKKYCGSREAFGIKEITLPDAKKDEAYTDENGNMVKLEVTGAGGEYYFEVVDPSKLPAGLELSSEGNLSGTVTAELGEYTFTVKAVNGNKDAEHYYNYKSVTKDFTIKVVEGAVKCKVDSCTEPHKGVCNVVNDEIVCSCDEGYQDNDENGTCEETCATASESLNCNEHQHCDDSNGEAVCVCNENWQDDGNGGVCNVCVDGMHENPDDPTVCDPDVRTVTCTNVPDPNEATWADAFENGTFEQTWVNDEYVPNVDPDKCAWKCLDENKVHDVDAGKCICSAGLVDDGNGGCKAPCTDNQISNADGTCSCYPGYAGDDCLRCADGYKATDEGLCVFDCSVKANSHVNDSNDGCICDDGYFEDNDGNCINPCEGVDCGDISKVCVAVDANTTNCICDAGLNFVDDGNGNCGCDTENTHRVLASTGDSCECDSANNYVEDLDGTCVLDTECTVDSFTAADPANDSYATAADLTDDLADGSVHYDDLNNQDVSCNSSEDWYKVTVAANKKLEVKINFDNSNGNLNLKLYVGGDGYDDDIETSSSSFSDTEVVSHVFREETDVYIKVYGSTYSMVRNKYSMDVKVEDVAPLTELNGGDTCQDAVAITQAGSYSGTTTGLNDDYQQQATCLDEDEEGYDAVYAVTIEPGKTLKAKLTASHVQVDSNPYVVLYMVKDCTDFECVASNSHWTQSSPVSFEYKNTTSEAQTFFLIIDAWGNAENKKDINYVLDIEFTGDSQEVVCDPACDQEREVCQLNENDEPECVCNNEDNYFYNGTTCVNPCSAVTCGENSHCEAQNALETECVCDEGYKMFNGSCQTYVSNNGGDTCDDAVEITSGLYSGSTVGMNNNLGGCDETANNGAGFGGDAFYKFTVDHEVSFYSILKTTGDIAWNPVLRLYKAHEGDACALTSDDSLFCNDQDLLSGTAEAIDYDDYLGSLYLTRLEAGTYYLIVDGNNDRAESDNPIAAEGEYELEVNFGNPCYENTCDDTQVCVPDYSTGLADDNYTCECNNSEGYYDDGNGNCVNPCDSANCPDVASHGDGTCKATSLTEYTCGCEDNYFEVVAQDGTRTCESGCDLDDAPDCSGMGDNVVCRATSATEAQCGCDSGYVDADDTDAFNCVELFNGGDTCQDAVEITESGTYYGSTESFTNDYGNEATCISENEKGKDVVYSVQLPAGYTLDATLNGNNSWVGLYLLDDCSTMNCLTANSTMTEHPPVSISYTNEGDDALTLFLVIDTYSLNSGMNYQLDVAITPPPLCGNGTIDTDEGEECDASADDPLNGASCLLGGTLACDSECHYDRSGCWECVQDNDCTDANKPVCYLDTHTCGAAEAECGNNTIESPEECDGTAPFNSACQAGYLGEKTCVAAGQPNECTIDDSSCQFCEDELTVAADNSTRANATELTMEGNTKTWSHLSTSAIDGDTCKKVEDWYKITVPANNKISVDLIFTHADGDLDLRLYEGDATATIDSSASSTDNEHVDNAGHINDTDTVYYINVRYGQNVYDMIITFEETCNVDSDCSTAGDVCINNVCYDSNPCDNADCSSKPNSTCQPLNGTEFECVCNDGYTELDGQCLQEQAVGGADVCGDGSGLPVITQTGIYTGSVSTDDTTLGCSSGSSEVFYKIELAEDSYLKVEETKDYSEFNANLALRTACDDQTSELECNAFGDTFEGYYEAGTYYLVVEGYNSSSVNYTINVVIKPNPCNGVTCDTVNGTGVCTPSSDASSYTCECNEGYYFDGNNTCITPCQADSCDSKPNSTCVATGATEFTCECNEGFYDDNGTCVNPCDGNTCDPNTEVCVATAADAYECQCADGYVMNGTGDACVEDLGVDRCDDPDLYLITDDGTFYGSTDGYAHDYSCGSGSGHDAVYAVDLNAGDEINVILSSDQDTVLFLMKGCSDEAASCLVEKDEAYSGQSESFDFTATEAGRYIIGVRRWGSTSDMEYALQVIFHRNTQISTIGWCNTQWPKTVDANDTVVYGQVYVQGITDVTTDTGSDQIFAQLCYYADGQTVADAVCVDASFNKSVENSDNDEYMATLTGLDDGTYYYYFQFKTSDQANYSLCDLNDDRNGTAYNNGETYNGDTGVATIGSQGGGVFISEYIEGSSNNKAIEIYNGTGADIDLSNYQLWKISNGGNWPEQTLTLSGTLAAGDVYVVCNSSSVAEILNVCDKTEANITSFNGDDAVGLAENDGNGSFALIDVVGTDGADPGSGWDVAGVSVATKDHTLRRKSSVTVGNTDWATSAGTDASSSEWEVFDQDTFDGLGSF